MRCGALRAIRAKGFVDLKEQALPELAKTCDVRVAMSQHPVALPVRTLEQYIRTLRALSEASAELTAPDPYAEEWTPTFSLVDESATVAKNSLVHDSVVMTGAKVGAGAVVVRSLVCEGAVVQPGQTVFDTIVASKPATRGGAA
jgi:NDP-sugar pyrophosphorylase family protein